MDAIEINKLTKKFGNKTVLNNLNLVVKESELFGFLGRNGAGKSTLINILTSNVHKTEGEFKILNYNEADFNKIKSEIGVMPDVSNLYEDMNGFEFLKYMAELKYIKITRANINSILDSVGLEILPRMKIKSYSFGMKKKLSLAQALIGSPKLIFLDEPTSGVDPESIIHIQNLISNLNRQGTTIFLTSHNLNEVEKLCTSIAILKDGSITVNGSLEKVKKSYSNDIEIAIKARFPSKEYYPGDLIDSKFLRRENDLLYFRVSGEEEIPHIISQMVKDGANIYSVIQNTATLEDIFLS